MRLHTITVRQYRRHKELRVELDPARTLIGGPNESGKSTLVEAAHRALFLRAKGNTEVHRRMESQTHGGKPEVELEFEAGGRRYTLVKCFKGTTGTARLTQAAGATWQGDEAEEELARLLKLNGTPRKPLEQWAHLWVWQGSSANDPLIQAEAERDTLVQRLQAQGGAAVIQSALDTRVAARFATRTEETFKANGDPKSASDFGRAVEAEKEAQNEEDKARLCLQNLEQAVTRHEQAAVQMAEAEAALRLLETERVQLEQRAAQVALLRREEETHARLADEARRAHEGRLLAEQQVSELRRTLATRRADLAPRREQLETLKQALVSARQTAEENEAAHHQAEEAVRAARALYDLAVAHAVLSEKTRFCEQLQQRAGRTEALTQKRAGLETRLASLPKVDAAVLDRLQAIERAHDSAQAVLKSVAAEITVLAGEGLVQLGNEVLQTGDSRTLTAETELSLGGTRVRIRPGGGTTLAEARTQAHETRVQLNDALGRLGVKTLLDASAVLAEKTQLQTEIKTVNAELKGLGFDKIAAECADADRELAAARAELDRRLGGTPGDPPDLPGAKTMLLKAEDRQQICRGAREQAQAALKNAEAALAVHAETMRQTEREITELEVRLTVLLDREGDDATRAQALHDALVQKDLAQSRLAGTRQALDQHQPRHLEADQAQFDRAWKAQNDKKTDAHEKRIAAAALLRRDGSSDPAAALALAAARARAAQAHRQAAQLHAQALRRVHQLFQQEQHTLADQFTRPLADRVGGYLQRLFGNDVRVDVAMHASAFESLTLSRDGQGAFSFDSLSNGAREQVAAAFRLALAEILAESHDGSLPIVFDDAFAHSDPDRVQHLQRMLDLAATRGLQILLLTCTPGDYAMLGAKEVRLG